MYILREHSLCLVCPALGLKGPATLSPGTEPSGTAYAGSTIHWLPHGVIAWNCSAPLMCNTW